MLHAQLETDAANSSAELDFLWVELTNRCNLQCVHCYSDSGPHTGAWDRLDRPKYEDVILEARTLGCRRVQFIGGEPTLNPDLPHLIALAAERGFTFIEVFSNLTRLSDDLLDCFRAYGVHVATSVYASDSATHDTITTVNGSFHKTVANIRRLLRAGVPLRAGVIEMAENAGATERTVAFLRSIGVDTIGTDRLRGFGRGCTDDSHDITELCGGCAERILCVGSDGAVSPCIMSKNWSVGSILDTPLADLARSTALSTLRAEIYRAVVLPGKEHPESAEILATCDPKICTPYGTCSPKWGPGPCEPNGCNPCRPKG
jgi:hypothetical protein